VRTPVALRHCGAALCAALIVLAAPVAATTANYQDWWWNAQQSGHGLNVGQQEDVLFVSWFTYDENGAGMWLVMTANLVGTRATGDWYRTSGPPLGTPFDPAKVTKTMVGTGTLTFGSLHDATLDWTVNGKSGSVQLTRQSWGSRAPGGTQGGRAYVTVTGCAGGPPLNVPVTSTYTSDGSTVTVVDDYRPIGTKVCTMNGALTPSGSYWFASGSYSCDNNQTGAWQATLLVRDQLVARDEVLTIDGSSCIDNQSVVGSPLP
jgi:hypothetical protein